MSGKRTGQHGIREEVLNVKLAELLSKRGLLSVPESILSEGAKRLPDVLIADYWGVRVVIEGRIADQPNVRGTLERNCKKRIEEGIAAITIGVVYPEELRNPDWAKIDHLLQSSTFCVKVFSEAGEGEWTDSNLEGLSATLRRAYESLVREDVVDSAVEELRQSIEVAARHLSSSPGTAQRLRRLLVVPRDREEDENDER